MKNITTLRNHLFDQLERLAQANSKEELEQEISKATEVVKISDALLRTAQVEAQVISTVKELNTAFIPDVIQEITLKQHEEKNKPLEFTKTPSFLSNDSSK